MLNQEKSGRSINKARLMQGLTDEPLNETGIMQAKKTREMIGDVHFDAVYASPLNRAIMTGSIIGGVDPSEVIIDPRIIEADFGKYEQRKYYLLGPAMTLYWALPEIFPAPKTVETIAGIVWRPKPHNCEIRVFESVDGKHTFLETISAKKSGKK